MHFGLTKCSITTSKAAHTTRHLSCSLVELPPSPEKCLGPLLPSRVEGARDTTPSSCPHNTSSYALTSPPLLHNVGTLYLTLVTSIPRLARLLLTGCPFRSNLHPNIFTFCGTFAPQSCCHTLLLGLTDADAFDLLALCSSIK